MSEINTTVATTSETTATAKTILVTTKGGKDTRTVLAGRVSRRIQLAKIFAGFKVVEFNSFNDPLAGEANKGCFALLVSPENYDAAKSTPDYKYTEGFSFKSAEAFSFADMGLEVSEDGFLVTVPPPAPVVTRTRKPRELVTA